MGRVVEEVFPRFGEEAGDDTRNYPREEETDEEEEQMNHRHFKLNQVKARIEGRKALYKQFRAVSKEELKEKYDVD